MFYTLFFIVHVGINACINFTILYIFSSSLSVSRPNYDKYRSRSSAIVGECQSPQCSLQRFRLGLGGAQTSNHMHAHKHPPTNQPIHTHTHTRTPQQLTHPIGGTHALTHTFTHTRMHTNTQLHTCACTITRTCTHTCTQGITPLFIACQEKHVSVVRALLKGKADPNKRNKVGRDLVDYVPLV